MNQLTRRTFIGTGVASAVLATSRPRLAASALPDEPSPEAVHFQTDGLHLTPAEYSQLLARLAKEGRAEPDIYLSGGCVAALEARLAKLLGKERAVFLPTGTLANHLAIRCQAGAKSRALVQAESHVYRDTLDCVQTLSHLNLVPLAADKATVPLGAVEEAYRQATSGPFPVQVGVISLECPVRRKLGETFDLAEMKRIITFARKHEIKMHLDGARLWIASAYTGVGTGEYAALFDTVYISLYKYFNAGTGAILAGPQTVIEQVAHARKVFGGGLFQAWPYAAVALYYLEGFAERYQKAVAVAETLLTQFEQHPRFRVERIPHGTNIVKLHVRDVDGAKYQAALRNRGVYLGNPRPNSGEFMLTINESLNRHSPDELAKVFIESLSE
jgi:threonine aldolase